MTGQTYILQRMIVCATRLHWFNEEVIVLEFNFKLTEQEAQIVLNALTKEPYGLVVDVVNNIQQQAGKQREVTA